MSGTSSPGLAPDALELAALLCSRVCHDLISPVGAIVNGLEVLDDNPKPEDREFALDLIRKSAKTASARLQFCRLAFGAAGSSGAQIDLGDAQTMARGHIEDGKITISWNLPRLLLPKNRVKLLLNMLVIAQQTIPRGGTLTDRSDRRRRDHELSRHRGRPERPPAAEYRRPPEREFDRHRRCACGAALLYAAIGAGLRAHRHARARRGKGGRVGRLSARRGAMMVNQRLTTGGRIHWCRLISLLSPFFSICSTNIKRFA